MISYLIDGLLLIALLVTSLRMVSMHRELRRVSGYHADYQRIFDQTALALDGIEVSIQEINVKGSQILNALGQRIDEAREIIADIDTMVREAKRQQTLLKTEIGTMVAQREREQRAGERDQRKVRSRGAVLTEPAVRPQHADGFPPTVVAPLIGADHAVEQRIHRIDQGRPGPFRSVSMSYKESI